MNYSSVRTVLALNTAPVLVRTSRSAGYYEVAEVSTVARTGTRRLPAPPLAVSDDWLLWTLSLLTSAGAGAVTPFPSWELPDLAQVTDSGTLAGLGGAYDSYLMALALPNWVGVCGDVFRYSLLHESTGKSALVFYFEL
jgi:hypothetical protein